MRARWVAAVAESSRKRSAIQPAMKWRSTREFSLLGSAASAPTWYAGGALPPSRSLSDLRGVAQTVHLREDIAGVVAGIRRHGLEQLLRIAALVLRIAPLAIERDAHLGDCDLGSP